MLAQAQDVQITPTISLGQILLILSVISTVLGTAIPIYFRLKYAYKIGQIEFDRRIKEYIDQKTAEQTAHLEKCIHAIPNHPENPANQVNPVIE
jgi:hypothetical protein